MSLDHTGGWGRRVKQNENDWKFKGYKGDNLGYDMMSESISPKIEKLAGRDDFFA